MKKIFHKYLYLLNQNDGDFNSKLMTPFLVEAPSFSEDTDDIHVNAVINAAAPPVIRRSKLLMFLTDNVFHPLNIYFSDTALCYAIALLL